MINPNAAFDELAPNYDSDGSHRTLAERLVAGLAPLRAKATVLDVATGTGAAAFAALRRLDITRVVAVDISEGMIQRARQAATTADPTGRIEWQVAAGVPAPMPAGSADLVLCASSLQFLGRAALTDWLRVLRPGGQVAFTLTSAACFRPSGAFAELAAADLPMPADEQQAARIAGEAGFENVAVTTVEIAGDRPKVVFLVYGTAEEAKFDSGDEQVSELVIQERAERPGGDQDRGVPEADGQQGHA
ncbi:class I SAM-dependent methyltransferase [Actinoalloteichus hymeniacidonis]|uniref:Methyltransferase family protein n=1 Tax=Actinoalloteichus hymeniacidonis TaxID=340345 RepID=A0AAC9MWF4_9PSEU|nr:class I SAM-dependent methyltransferase [Actinoalloteichus hymeniacidonis]AOS61215.1 methyltransferase family protein [Actinoalloteichus hymeniacidonis]MBB5910783.1 ubiquinone/menaquinone biosynthesis C-methylase UbiE [Actinoalloteichus hymeniacidonis]